MKNSLIRSRFRNLYLGIALTWIVSCIAVYFVARTFIEPNILQSRVQDLESLTRSQRAALLYSDNRTMREELLRTDILKRDQDFDELRVTNVADFKRIDEELRDCHFVTTQSCVGNHGLLLFSEPHTESHPSFVLSLHTDYFSSVPHSHLLKILSCLMLGIFFGFAAWAIRQQEKFFISKVDLLASSFSRVEKAFKSEEFITNIQSPTPDEFSVLSEGLEQAGALLERKTAQIEGYKKDFEKRTQIEQLAQTINYTSHNLKAPILEGVDFFQNLPYYLESMPREKIIRMGSSLERRFTQAGESLQNALSKTRESYTRPENVAVGKVLRTFCQEVKDHPHYSDIRIELETEGFSDLAQIFCSPHEMGAALWNLTKNTRDAKKDARIRIRAFASDTKAVVHFQDNGPGIPEFQRERVFEDFFTTKHAGTGLGLGSVKSTLSKYGGTIEAISSSSGALFEMKIPFAKPLISEAGNA
jgi:signal transduction histidine kinase